MSCIIVTLCCVLGLGQGPGDNSASSLIKSSLTELTPHSNNQYTSRSMAASQCLSVSPRLTEYLLTYLTAWIFEFDVLEAKLQRKELKVYSRHAETIYTVWTFKFFLQNIENLKLSIALPLHTYFELIRNKKLVFILQSWINNKVFREVICPLHFFGTCTCFKMSAGFCLSG